MARTWLATQRRISQQIVPVDATEDDLEDDVLVRLLEHVDERYPAPFGSNTERTLGRRGLLAHDGHRWRPTLAALLVAGCRPELFVASCAVELHVDGTASELDGAVPELVRRFGEGVVPGVDPDLLAEVVLNALLHRNWAIDARVRVALTGARLLVISSGDPTPTDPVAARRRKLACLLAIGSLRAATAKAAEVPTQGDDVEAKPQDGQSTD